MYVYIIHITDSCNHIAGEGSMLNIDREAEHFKRLSDQLRQEFPDADEDTLQDTVDGLTNLAEAVTAVLRSRQDDLTLLIVTES